MYYETLLLLIRILEIRERGRIPIRCEGQTPKHNEKRSRHIENTFYLTKMVVKRNKI